MVRGPSSLPEAGDVVRLEFDPKPEYKQAGRRQAMVLSQASYNGRAGMVVCCPMTIQIKEYQFDVALAVRHRM